MSPIEQPGRRLSARPGEVIDRRDALHVTIEGRILAGFQGDTAASLLAAHGRHTFFGSLHEPRPGGVRSADSFDREAWVWVEGDGLVPAGSYRVRPDDRLSSYQRRASTPSARTPMVRWPLAGRSSIDRQSQPASPVTPPWLASLRRGAGRVVAVPGGRMQADLVVVGAGMAGMVAARAAADLGADVILVEADPCLGGSSRWSGQPERQTKGFELAATISSHPGIAVLASSVACETRPDGTVVVVERGGDEERVWILRARSVILACGAIERRLPFNGADLPGVMTPAGVRRLIELWAVQPGQRALLVCDERANEASQVLARDLGAVGVDVVGVSVLGGAAGHLHASGQLAVEEVSLPSGRQVAVDLLVTSFGLAVETALVHGLGGVLTRVASRHQLAIAHLPPNCAVVGRASSAGSGSEAGARAAGRRLARLVLERPRPRRLTPPLPPVVLAGTEPTVVRPVTGLIDATLDLRVEALDGFAASVAAATERLVSAARLPGLSPSARMVLADLAASGAASAAVVDLTLHGGGPIDGPTLAALAALHRPTLRASPLVDFHRAAGAVFAESDGWSDVLHYGDPISEGEALRTGVALADLTCASWFEVSGPAAAKVVEGVLGRFCRGDRFDQLIEVGHQRLLRVGPDAWQISAPCGRAGTLAADLAAASFSHPAWEVAVVAHNEDNVRVRVCGPATIELLEALGLEAIAGRRSPVRIGSLSAFAVIVSTSDAELQVSADAGRALWTSLLVAGERLALRPVGIDALQTFDEAQRGFVSPGSDRQSGRLTTALAPTYLAGGR